MRTICILLIFARALIAQEPATRASLTSPIIRGPLLLAEPKPLQRLDIPAESILDSKETIVNGQKITIQEIKPITLPPIPPPPQPKPLTTEQQAAYEARIAAAPKHRALMLSCTIYDGTHTLLRGYTRTPEGAQPWEAWSNINFHHFNSLPQFKKNNTIYSLFYGIGDEDTAKTAARMARLGKPYTPPAIPELPELPADAATESRFIVTKGNPTAEDLAPIIGLHELYQDHHQDLISEYNRIKAHNEKLAAERLANPPNPKPDLIIQHWTVTPDAPPAPTKLVTITPASDAAATKTPTTTEEGETK